MRKVKLIYCPTCKDIFRLTKRERTCRCGRSSGYLLKDGITARINDYAVPLGMSDRSIGMASAAYIYKSKKITPVDVWVYPKDDPNIKVEPDVL